MRQRDGDVGREDLEEADRKLRYLEDVILEDDETVPKWLVAARLAVSQKILQGDDAGD